MSKASQDLTGLRFGRWSALRHADRKYYYVCRCDCGREREIYYNALLTGGSKGCRACIKHDKRPSCQAKNHEDAKLKYIGKEINGWKVVDILPLGGTGTARKCRAICPKCHKEVTVHLHRLSKITHCAECNRDIAKKTDIIHDTGWADGSSLISVRARLKGVTNRNSTTKINGVSRMGDGKYRAYINFQRKQYSLGVYDTIEDAAAARKKAEDIIYAPYLQKNEGWEEAMKSQLSAISKS